VSFPPKSEIVCFIRQVAEKLAQGAVWKSTASQRAEKFQEIGFVTGHEFIRAVRAGESIAGFSP
jgi:hypothetical protein